MIRVEKIIPSIVEGRFLKKVFLCIKEHGYKLYRKIDRMIGILAKFLLSINTKIVDKKVMFISFQGDYTCNPKYICEELLKDERYEIVWSSRGTNLENDLAFPTKVKVVEQYTYEFYKELASSKVWVVNSVEFLKNPLWKKKNQVLIETWHGSLGLKKFGKDVNSGISWVKAAELCGKWTDYIISNSSFESNVYRDTFWKKNKILEYGHPRNDILFDSSIELRSEIKKKVGMFSDINIDDVNILLYAPTFRDSHSYKNYNIDFLRLKEKLSERFGGNWEILVRYHPTVRKYNEKRNTLQDVIDVTLYPDIQELLIISDVAITDYSSWIYDFILQRKPGFLYAPDIEEYGDERGFYYPIAETPFLIAEDNDTLCENIIQFDEKKYQKELDRFFQSKGCIEDGNASKKVSELILNIVSKGEAKE